MARPTKQAEEGRAAWSNTGRARPDFAIAPKPGQESVWDYPRPPRITRDGRLVEVKVGDVVVASTTEAVRVLETASPPTFYLPPSALELDLLERAQGSSHCEWKGVAVYWDVVTAGDRLPSVAWSYPDPYPEFVSLRDHVSFYPGRIACFVDSERVRPQPGRFYGGWVTAEIVGPFKGEPGSEGW